MISFFTSATSSNLESPKARVTTSPAESVGLTKKQAVQSIEALVALAYKNAKNSFTIPGLGKIVLVNR